MQSPSERLKQMMSTKATHMQERMSGGQDAAGSQVKEDRAQVSRRSRTTDSRPY